MARIRRVAITERSLRKYFGYAYPDLSLVEITKGLNDRAYLGTLIHELIHILKPEWTENAVDSMAANLTHYVWKAGYRRKKGLDTKPGK